jgi:hypothetical protein
MHHQFCIQIVEMIFELITEELLQQTDKVKKGEFKIRALIRFLSDRYSYNYLLLTRR